jgi:uncharacterized membrane protein YccC
MTVSAVLTLVIGQWLEVPLVLWSVLTAIIVTQTSVGRSLKATIDYFIGTLGGAVYAGAVAALIPHAGNLALFGVLAAAMAPLALLAAVNSSFNVAPATAAIVVLAPGFAHSTPFQSASFRLIEVALGAAIGLLVSLTVLPARAHAFAIEAAAATLDLIAQALQELLAGFTGKLSPDAIRPIQERIGKAIAQLDAVLAEARRERVTQLGDAPDPGPLLRTLLRLRHDLVIVGRAAVEPLPQALQMRLAAPLAQLGAAASAYLRESAAALARRTMPPPLDAAEAAFAAYAAEIADIRREGLMRALRGDALERLFTLGFALEELRQHLLDLEKWVAEWGQQPKLARLERMD